MRYTKECMSVVINVIIQNLKFYDDGYKTVAIANNLSYEDVASKVSGYSVEEIKTCFYILEKGKYLDVDSSGVQSPRITGFTVEGCRALLNNEDL